MAPDRPRKSLSVETTYVSDLPDAAACREALDPLIDDLVARLGRLREGRRSSSSSSRSGSTISRTLGRVCVGRPDTAIWQSLLATAVARKVAGCDCSVSVCVLPSRSNRAAGFRFRCFPKHPEDPHVVDVERRKAVSQWASSAGWRAAGACLQSASKSGSASCDTITVIAAPVISTRSPMSWQPTPPPRSEH